MATWELAEIIPQQPGRTDRWGSGLQAATISGVIVVLLGSAVYLTTRPRVEQGQIPVPVRVSAPPAVSTPPRAQPAANPRPRPVPLAGGDQIPSVQAAQTSRRSVVVTTSFVLEFGQFGSGEAANTYARIVRSKGYIARVIKVEGAYRVLSRNFRSKAMAERWTEILDGVGLQAHVTRLSVQQAKIVTKFAPEFGQFQNRATADAYARYVRSKGYLIVVARAGPEFRVIGRSHPTRASAESWADIFRDIGLPVNVMSIQEAATTYTLN